MKLRVLDLFSGIGGFSLGLERAKLEGAAYDGFETVAFCEIEEFPRKVLAKHWPNVPCYRDVRELTAERLAADGIAVDAICGGFPCQDISFAGKGAGLAGERSGLFYEVARLVGELGPRYVVLENVGALLSRGLDAVLGTLASLGYDAEWHCIPASAVGAPHRRDRVWIVAYPGGEQHESRSAALGGKIAAELSRANATSERWDGCWVGSKPARRRESANMGEVVPHAFSERRTETGGGEGRCWAGRGSWAIATDWAIEPDVGRVAHGVPARVDRLRGLGNAVVPQIPELIGNAILQALAEERVAA